MNRLTLLLMIMPLLYACLTLPNLFVILRYYLINRKKEYLALFSLLLIFSFFLLSEGLSRVFGLFLFMEFPAVQLARLQELSLGFLYMAVPYILKTNIHLSLKWKKINRFFFLLGTIFVIFLIFFAFVRPNLFLDTEKMVVENFISRAIPLRNASGLLFQFRDILFVLYFLYGLIVFVRNRKHNIHNPVQSSIIIGSLIVFILSLGDLVNNIFKIYTAEVSLLGFSLGVTVFSVFVFSRIIIFFLRKGSIAESIQYELQEKQKVLEHQANHRTDTGLLNRDAFHLELDRSFSEYGEEEKQDGLIFVNIDNYTHIYESFGHELSLHIIKQLSYRMQNILVEESVLFQVGNNEFTILLKSVESRDYLKRFTDILRSILIQRIPVKDDFYFISVSIGVLFIPEDGTDVKEIMKNAYTTVNNAKAQPEKILFFNKDLSVKSRERIQIVNQIQYSIKKRDFYFHYQPVIDNKGNVRSLEALVRWDFPFPIEEMISHAESSGIMPDLGMNILALLIEDIILMKRQGISYKVFFNLSPSQIIRDGFAIYLVNRLEAANLSVDDIGFEITENVLISEDSHFRKNFNLLKDLGYEIVLDDFGKGYSSLSYLYKLPLDKLKIDKEFLNGVPIEEEKKKLLSHIISLASDLNYKIVMEGVETEEQLGFLKTQAVDFYQGFYFYRPVGIDDLLLLKPSMDSPHSHLL